MTTEVSLVLGLRGADRMPLPDGTQTVVEVQDRATRRVAARRAEVHTSTAHIGGLEPHRVYVVRVWPDKHRGCGKFVRLGSEGATLPFYCPVDPKAVRAIDIAGELFEAEDARSEAGLLNITAKMASTRLPTGSTLDEYVDDVARVEPDRIYFETTVNFREFVNAATDGELFEPALDTLHAPFDDNHVVNGSVKTLDRYGNLQLTFHVGKRLGGLIVEADIDEARGIGHLFQVLRNFLPGVETDPYDVHEILRFYQELDPGYELVL